MKTPPNKLLSELSYSAYEYGRVGKGFNSPQRRRFRKALRQVKAHILLAEDKARLLPHERLVRLPEPVIKGNMVPPKGWRVLKYNETLKPGDRYWHESNDEWFPSSRASSSMSQCVGTLYARKITTRNSK